MCALDENLFELTLALCKQIAAMKCFTVNHLQQTLRFTQPHEGTQVQTEGKKPKTRSIIWCAKKIVIAFFRFKRFI